MCSLTSWDSLCVWSCTATNAIRCRSNSSRVWSATLHAITILFAIWVYFQWIIKIIQNLHTCSNWDISCAIWAVDWSYWRWSSVSLLCCSISRLEHCSIFRPISTLKRSISRICVARCTSHWCCAELIAVHSVWILLKISKCGLNLTFSFGQCRIWAN